MPRRDAMHSNRALRIMVMFVAVALLALGFLVPAQRARADANAPNWSAGDFWLYVDSSNSNNTLRVEVVGREATTTLFGATYDAFHLRETTTAGSVAFTTDSWVRPSDLGIVKTSITLFGVTTITTFDPPQTQALFPLTVLKAWTFSVTGTIKVGNGNPTNFTVSVSEQVKDEIDVSVPAGTFHCFSIQTLGTGAYTKVYYSDSVGYWTKREMYDASTPPRKTGEAVLAQYRYTWNTTILAIIGVVVGVVALAVIAFLWKKRKQSMGQLGGVAGPRMAPPMQPPYGPQMPPQQPPQGPPP